MVVVIFDSNLNAKNKLKAELESFNSANFANQFLSVGEIVFDEAKNIEVFFINSLKTKTAAERYNDVLDGALANLKLTADDNFNTFEISRDNFTKLFGTKKLKEYLTFNKRFYK